MELTRRSWVTAVLLAQLLRAALPPSGFAAGGAPLWPVCAGDCDADGAVSVDEILAGVQLVLSSARPQDTCASFDADGDARVTVGDIVAAVVAALRGCPEPAFPFGAYFWPDHAYGQSGSALGDLAGFGLNTVVAYYEYVKPDVPPFSGQPDCHRLVQEAQRFGISFFVGAPQGYQINTLSDDELTERLQATVDCVGGSPFYQGWMIDEPELTGYDAALLDRFKAILRRIDGGRRVWVNFNPWAGDEQVRRFAAGADIVGFDIYPVREGDGSPLSNLPLSVVGQQTERARQAAPDKAEVWMILQAFGYSDLPNEGGHGRRPTLDEFRFMAYDALVHGAAGVIFFGSHQLRNEIPLDEPLWDTGVRALGHELAEIGAPLRRGQIVGDLHAEPESLITRGMRLGRREYVLAVNESAAEVSGTLRFDEGLLQAHELPAESPVEIDGDHIMQRFEPWGVHIYCITR